MECEPVVEVYAMRVNLDKSAQEISDIMQKVPEWRSDAAKRFKMIPDKVRCLAAYLLAERAIMVRSGCGVCKIEIRRGEFGKPELISPKGCFFNISHSGQWVVCATDSAPVGIDVERIKPTDFGIAKRFFSEEEFNYINEKPEESKLDAFYETWSYKESYIKAVGMGLSKPLGSFSVCRDGYWQATVKDTQPQEYNFKLKRLFLDNNFVLAVAGTHEIANTQFVDETALYNSKNT